MFVSTKISIDCTRRSGDMPAAARLDLPGRAVVRCDRGRTNAGGRPGCAACGDHRGRGCNRVSVGSVALRGKACSIGETASRKALCNRAVAALSSALSSSWASMSHAASGDPATIRSSALRRRFHCRVLDGADRPGYGCLDDIALVHLPCCVWPIWPTLWHLKRKPEVAQGTGACDTQPSAPFLLRLNSPLTAGNCRA